MSEPWRRVRARARAARHAVGRCLRDGQSLRIVLSLGMVVGLGATGTFAAWTDEVEIAGTSITSGTIDLKVDDVNSVTGYNKLNIGNMVPGNSTAAVVVVKNSGTAPLKYWLDATTTNPDGKGLGTALVAKVSTGAVTGTSPAATCGGTVLNTTNTTFTANLLPSSAPRQLNPGATENLCLQATLPSAANTGLQGANTGITFTFTGTSF